MCLQPEQARWKAILTSLEVLIKKKKKTDMNLWFAKCVGNPFQ